MIWDKATAFSDSRDTHFLSIKPSISNVLGNSLECSLIFNLRLYKKMGMFTKADHNAQRSNFFPDNTIGDRIGDRSNSDLHNKLS